MELWKGPEHQEQLRQLGGEGQVRVRLSPQGRRDRTRRNGLKLCHGRFKLDMRKNFFTERVVSPQHRLLRAVVESPSLEGFK